MVVVVSSLVLKEKYISKRESSGQVIFFTFFTISYILLLRSKIYYSLKDHYPSRNSVRRFTQITLGTMRQLTSKECYKIITEICTLDSTLEDIGYPEDNPFRTELSSKIDNLHNLVLRVEAEEAKKPKLKDIVVDPDTCSLTWYDVKSRTEVLVRDMHTYHILNAKRVMLRQTGIKAEIYVKAFDAILFSRHKNLPNLDGAPNLLERRV